MVLLVKAERTNPVPCYGWADDSFMAMSLGVRHRFMPRAVYLLVRQPKIKQDKRRC